MNYHKRRFFTAMKSPCVNMTYKLFWKGICWDKCSDECFWNHSSVKLCINNLVLEVSSILCPPY